MDFTLKNEHCMARERFKEFAAKEVLPLAREIDEAERFPRESIEKMQKLGLMGLPIPKEYEGQGYDTLTYVLCIEELSKVCASTGVILSTHTSLCSDAIYKFGTKKQKDKYLKPLAAGRKLGAFGLTEPNAGTDAGSQQTEAVLKNDEYVINGNKIFITNAKEAEIYIIFAMTDKAKGTKGISSFIMERDTPGFTFGKQAKKMGIRGSVSYELIFDNCAVPKENLLGEEGKGFALAMKILDGGRVGISAQSLGIAAGALEKTIAYVKKREQFGKPISKFQNTQFQIAEMATKVEAARLLVYKAAVAKDNQMNYSLEASMAKLYASRIANEITSMAVQLHGGYGYIRDYEVERMMRDAKITEIYEGTSEVQKMVIAGKLL